jgi:TIR domain
MQVFISYSRKDAEFVRDLADDLKSNGLDVWLDTEDLATADDDRWRRSIVQGIRESSVLIVVLSPNSVASEQVERELTIAAETKRRIIPIVKSPCELPDGFQFELAGIQRIDFSELPRAVALEHLVHRVSAAGPHTPPPDSPSAEAPPIESPSPVPASPVGAAAGPASVLPPPTSVAPAFEASKPSTAPPKPPGPVAMSVPTAPPSPRPRRRLAAILLGAGSAVVLAIVLLVVLGGGGGGDDGLAGSEGSGPTTDATSEDLSGADAPSITVGGGLAAQPQAAPRTGPSETEVNEMAADLVEELEQAYNDRDWEAVRRLNPNQARRTDEDLDGGYGTLVDGHHLVFTQEVTGPTKRHVVGAVIAHDRDASGVETTNVACISWDADVAAGTIAQGAYKGEDGNTHEVLPGWLPEEQFESTARDYCS